MLFNARRHRREQDGLTDIMRRKALAVIIVIFLVCTWHQAAAAPESTVAVEAPGHARPGDTVTVNVTVMPGEALGGMQCGIMFNASVLEAWRVDGGDLFDIWLNSSVDVDNGNGSIRQMVGLNLAGNTTTDTGVFATLTFNATAPGLGWIRLVNVNLTDPGGGGLLPAITVNDTVVIENDSTPPSLAYTLSPAIPDGDNGWYVGPVNVSVNASDTYGVANVSYRVDGGIWHTTAGTTTSFSIITSGNHTVALRATDSGGNVNGTDFQVWVDDTAPFANITLTGTEIASNVYRDNVTVAITAQDAPSGVNYSEYRLDGSAWTAYGGMFPVTGQGNHTLLYRAVDLAGNTGATGTRTFEIVGNEAPSAGFTVSTSEPATMETIQFTDTSSDPDGSIVNWTWSFDDGAQSYEQNASHSYSMAGTYTITLEVRDDSGATGTASDTVTVSNRPPHASFTIEPAAPSTYTTIYFNSTSSDPEGGIVNWTWQMDDGTTLYGEHAQHRYTAGGDYTVTLEVTDSHGDTDTETALLTVNAPPAAPSSPSPDDGDSGVDINPSLTVTVSDPDGDDMTVTFHDASNGDVIGSSNADSDGTASVTWNGLSYDSTYSWYAVAGDGSATNRSDTWSFTTEREPSPPEPEPPSAAFSYSIDGHTVSFTDESSDPDGGITAWQWQYGDGGSGSGEQVEHRYSEAGRYTVTLTVTDSDGLTDTAEQTLVVNAPPAAAFELPDNVTVGSLANFTDRSTDDTGSIVNWTWSFGDGTQSYEQNASHSYSMAGTYTVTLDVTDSYGATGTVSHVLTVQPDSPPQPAYEFSVLDIDVDTSLLGSDSARVSIANTGTQTAENVSCTLSVDGTVIDSRTIGRLTANDTVTLSFTVDLSPLRSHTLRADVDPDDKFPEENESNNTMHVGVPVCWLPFILAAAIVAAAISIALYLYWNRTGSEKAHREVTVEDEQEVRRCLVCRGKLKVDAAAVRCACGALFHRSCATRVGTCPDCGRALIPGQGAEEAERTSDEDSDGSSG